MKKLTNICLVLGLVFIVITFGLGFCYLFEWINDNDWILTIPVGLGLIFLGLCWLLDFMFGRDSMKKYKKYYYCENERRSADKKTDESDGYKFIVTRTTKIEAYWNDFERYVDLLSLLKMTAEMCKCFSELSIEEKNKLRTNGHLALLIKIRSKVITIFNNVIHFGDKRKIRYLKNNFEYNLDTFVEELESYCLSDIGEDTDRSIEDTCVNNS